MGTESHAQNVALLFADVTTWAAEVHSKVVGTGLISGSVDLINVGTSGGGSTPSLATLLTYDGVMVWSDASFVSASLMGDRLADYVDAGGGVVAQAFASDGAPLGGRWSTGGYSPMTPSSFTQGTPLTLGTISQPAHPLFTNVNSFSGGSGSWHDTGTLNPNATLLAQWSNGDIFAAELGTFNGTTLSLNFFPPSTDSRSDFWNANTDGAVLMANGLSYVAGGNPIPEPTTLALFGLGLAGAGAMRRRKRKA
jgi:hypothetical protein